MSATQPAAPAATAPPAPPPIVPNIEVHLGTQRVGCFVSVLVEGETLWKVWRAKMPLPAETAALRQAVTAGIAARGAVPMAELTTEAVGYFGGEAPMVLTETISVDGVTAAVAGAATTFSGEYTGAEPAALDFWFDAGVRGPAPLPVIGSGKWSFEIPAPPAGTHTLTVKVPGDGGAMGVSAEFVTNWAPEGPLPTTPMAASAATITVTTPGPLVAGANFVLSGTYTGAEPAEIEVDFDLDGGVHAAQTNIRIGAGTWDCDAVAPAAGSHTVTVKAYYVPAGSLPTATAVSGTFAVTAPTVAAA